MSVRIIPNQIVKAEVSYLNPVFTTTYLDVAAGASYVYPVFATTYVEVQISASVTFPDVLSVDVVTPTDLVTLATNKGLSDSITGIDALSNQFNKASVDTLNTPVDSFKTAFSKRLADAQSLADATNRSVTKVLADTTSPQDLASLEAVKSLSDSIAQPVDAVANVIFKALSDSISIADAITTILIFIRNFDESINTPDAYFAEFDLPSSEIASAFDNSTKEATKGLSDGLNAIDNMDGDITYAFIKVIGELLLSNDVLTIDFVTNKADNAVLLSSGTVVMQDYCDITYFSEDYVGISRTFT